MNIKKLDQKINKKEIFEEVKDNLLSYAYV